MNADDLRARGTSVLIGIVVWVAWVFAACNNRPFGSQESLVSDAALRLVSISLVLCIALIHRRAGGGGEPLRDVLRFRFPRPSSSACFFFGLGVLAIGNWFIGFSLVGLECRTALIHVPVAWLEPAANNVVVYRGGGIIPWAPQDAGRGVVIGMLVGTVVLAALAEEIMYRGYLPFVAFRRIPRGIGVFLASVLFSVGHLSVESFYSTIAFGLVMACIVQVTASLWPAVLVHAAYNLTIPQVLPPWNIWPLDEPPLWVRPFWWIGERSGSELAALLVGGIAVSGIGFILLVRSRCRHGPCET